MGFGVALDGSSRPCKGRVVFLALRCFVRVAQAEKASDVLHGRAGGKGEKKSAAADQTLEGLPVQHNSSSHFNYAPVHILQIRTMAGPIITRKSEGKMQRMVGKSSFTGSLAASSSTRSARFALMESE